MTSLRRVVVGISGASGAAIGVRVVERLAAVQDVEIHLVVSDAAIRTLEHEVGPGALRELLASADCSHAIDDIGACIASGSFHVAGMVVAPCSMRSLSAIATGISDNLLVRAADVQLKERRPLVLVTRESPLHLGHLRSMVAVTEMGAIVAPPAPSFYLRPRSIHEVVDQIAARSIDLLRLGPPLAHAWTGD